jgi:hypothetical protein
MSECNRYRAAWLDAFVVRSSCFVNVPFSGAGIPGTVPVTVITLPFTVRLKSRSNCERPITHHNAKQKRLDALKAHPEEK